jgi:hypothetical protein
MPGSPSRRLLRVGDGSVETKEAFHPRDFESLVDALIHAYQSEAASVFLPRDIGPDERSNPSRIRQRDCGEIQNKGARVVGAPWFESRIRWEALAVPTGAVF